MKNYIFIALAVLCQTVMAQEDVRPTIYFNSGKTITAEKIRLRIGTFNDLYLLADGKRIPTTQVKFFQNGSGFFASTQNLNPLKMNGFAERIDEGRINLFREISRGYDWEGQHYGYHGPIRSDYSTDLYYNKGLDNLKKTTYANLLVDLKDNQQSMDFLAAYRRKRNTATLLYGTAGASLLAGLILFMSNGSHQRPVNAFAPIASPKMPYLSYGLLGIGTGLGIAGMLNDLKSRDQLINAIDAYNR